MAGYQYRGGGRAAAAEQATTSEAETDLVQGEPADFAAAHSGDAAGTADGAADAAADDTADSGPCGPVDDLVDEPQDIEADQAVSRALSLAATIADAGRPGLTKWEIRSRIEHYRGQSETAFDRAFNRDKKLLGTLGFMVAEADEAVEAEEAEEAEGVDDPADPADATDAIDAADAGLDAGPEAAEGPAATAPGSRRPRGGSAGRRDHRYVIDHRRQGLPPVPITAAEALALDRAQLAWSGTAAQRSIRRAVGALTDAGRLDGLVPDGVLPGAVGESVAGPAAASGAGFETLVGRRPGEYRLGVGGDADLQHLDTLVSLPERAPVTFAYTARGGHRPARREVIPFGWGMRGRWYLVGHDLRRDGVRVFRLDRIHGEVEALDPATLDEETAGRARATVRRLAEGAVDADAEVRAQLADLGPVEEGETVELELTGSAADAYRPLARPGAVQELDDGAVRLTMESTLHDSVIADLAARLPEVRRIRGPRLTARIREHLQAVQTAHQQAQGAAPGRLRSAEDRGETGSRTDWRLTRAMEVLPFLHASGGAPASRVLARTGVSVEALHRLLITVQQAGTYDPAQYAEFLTVHPTIPLSSRAFAEQIVEPDVELSLQMPAGRSAETLGRPLQLASDGALSLLIALEGLIASEDPEDRGLQEAAGTLREKVRRLAPEEVVRAAAAARISWTRSDPYGHQEVLRAAIRDGHAVRLDYEKSDGERGIREVEPVDLVHVAGRSYVRAWCRTARGERNFLLARILGLESLPEEPIGDQARELAATEAARPQVPHRDGDPTALLRFAPPAAGAAVDYAPRRQRVDDDGSRTAEISYRSDAWLADLGLRGAGDVVVLRPRAVAEEILQRCAAGLARFAAPPAGE